MPESPCQLPQEDLQFCEKWIQQSSSSNDHLVRPPVSDIDLLDTTIPQFVWRNVEKYSNHTALTCGVSGRSYTFKEAREKSRNFATALLKTGVKPGEVLAVVLPNIPEYALIVLGALEAGIAISAMNHVYTKNEIAHQIKTADVKCMVTRPSLLPTVRGAVEILSSEMQIITVGYDDDETSEGCWDFDEMINTSADDSTIVLGATDPEDIAFLLFSSGTTGLSKGVPLTHRNITVNMQQMLSQHINHLKNTTSEHQDVIPAILPFFHVYGMAGVLLRGVSQGLHLITLPKFEPQGFLKILSTQKPLTCLCYCVPPVVKFLGFHPLVQPEHLKSIRVIVSAGAASVALSDIEALLDKMPKREEVHFFNMYGMTETSPGIFVPPIGNTEFMSVGCPLPNTLIRVVDSSGRNVGPGENGEIYVKGPQVMKGYLKNDKANAEAFDGDWFKTGDVGYYNEKCNFYIVERKKDLIKVKGFQVAPAELEEVLMSHPFVADVGVIGVPDDRTGEKPIAYVVPKPGVKFDPNEVSNFVAEQVAPFKKLGAIIVTDKILRGPTGKLLRKCLRDKYVKEQKTL